MALPGDHDIQFMLMCLLLEERSQKMPCTDVYTKLAESFPQLSWDEKNVPYRNSRSHWANRVQQAVRHLRTDRWILSPSLSGRGIWEVSAKGKSDWMKRYPSADDLLREMEAL
jgi:hypothetical protein